MVDQVVVGRYKAVAADLWALSTPEALFAFDQLGRKSTAPERVEELYRGAGAALVLLTEVGLARPLHQERQPDGSLRVVCGLTPRGRDLWMGLRNVGR